MTWCLSDLQFLFKLEVSPTSSLSDLKFLFLFQLRVSDTWDFSQLKFQQLGVSPTWIFYNLEFLSIGVSWSFSYFQITLPFADRFHIDQLNTCFLMQWNLLYGRNLHAPDIWGAYVLQNRVAGICKWWSTWQITHLELSPRHPRSQMWSGFDRHPYSHWIEFHSYKGWMCWTFRFPVQSETNFVWGEEFRLMAASMDYSLPLQLKKVSLTDWHEQHQQEYPAQIWSCNWRLQSGLWQWRS